jgi:hypothetical protein
VKETPLYEQKLIGPYSVSNTRSIPWPGPTSAHLVLLALKIVHALSVRYLDHHPVFQFRVTGRYGFPIPAARIKKSQI